MRFLRYMTLVIFCCFHVHAYDMQSITALTAALLGTPIIEDSCTNIIDTYTDEDTWKAHTAVAACAWIGGMYEQMNACALVPYIAPVDETESAYDNLTSIHNGMASMIRVAIHTIGTYCGMSESDDIQHDMHISDDMPVQQISVYCATAASTCGMSLGMKALRYHMRISEIRQNPEHDQRAIVKCSNLYRTSAILHTLGALAGHMVFFLPDHDA